MDRTFPTRTLVEFDNCESEGNVEGYCERLVVPLTTTWSAPDGCPSIVPYGNDTEWYVTCGPPSFEAVFENDGYYSPGICPENYRVGCTAKETILNNELIEPDETAGMCVPAGYECSDQSGDGSTVYWGIRTTTVRNQVLTADMPAFQIRWKSEDLIYLPNHPLDAQVLTTPASIPTSDLHTGAISRTEAHRGDHTTNTLPGVTSSGSESAGSPSGGGGGISMGAIAGIVIGVVGVLALVGAAVWFLLRRRKHQPEPIQQSDPTMVQYMGGQHPGGLQSPQMYHPRFQQAHQTYQQPYQQPYQPYVPGGVTSYYDKSNMSDHQAPVMPVYAQQGHPSPSLHGTTPSPPTHPPTSYVAPAPGLVLGNDLEVIAGPGSQEMDQRSMAPADREQAEEWERHQLLQRQHELQDRQARLEMEQIQREQIAIQQRLSQMPPR